MFSCQTWQWVSFSWLCHCSSSAPASSSSSSCSTPCWRARWLWSSRRCSTQVKEIKKQQDFCLRVLSAACLIVSTSASWWCLMSNTGTAFLRLLVRLQVHRSWCVMAKAQAQNAGFNQTPCSLCCEVVMFAVTLCSLYQVYCSPPVLLFDCRLPLPLLLAYRIHCHIGGSRDDLHRSEQLRLHLSYNSSCW